MKDQDLIGKTIKQAEKMIQRAGLTSRVTCKDGQHFIVTMDFAPNRINLTVQNNRVIETNRG